FDFRWRAPTGILARPKGAGGFRDGWDHNKEPNSGGAGMTYTFKLSRRLARHRAAILVTAAFLVACSGDDGLSGPGTGPLSRPGMVISPDSATLATNQSLQFSALTDA